MYIFLCIWLKMALSLVNTPLISNITLVLRTISVWLRLFVQILAQATAGDICKEVDQTVDICAKLPTQPQNSSPGHKIGELFVRRQILCSIEWLWYVGVDEFEKLNRYVGNPMWHTGLHGARNSHGVQMFQLLLRPISIGYLFDGRVSVRDGELFSTICNVC